MQLSALEIVAKSRTQGTVRAHLTRQIGMDARNFHYITQVESEAGTLYAAPDAGQSIWGVQMSQGLSMELVRRHD